MQVISSIKKAGIIMLSLVLVLCPHTAVYAFEPEIDGCSLAAQNQELELYYSKKSARIFVKNKETGYLWDSALPDESVPDGATEVQMQEMKSLLSLSYTAVSSFSSKTSSGCLESLEYEIETESIQNGFAYMIFMPQLDMRIRIEFSLDKYGLKVEIPEDGIEETIDAENKVSAFCKTITDKAEEQNKIFTKIKNNREIPKSLKKTLNQAITELEDMKGILEETKTPHGIRKTCEILSEKLDEIDRLMIGSSKEKGFYSKLFSSDEVPDKIKNQYRAQIQTLKNAELQLKIQMAQMQEISAAALVSIDLLPYFGACDDNREGYMLYPDGCGALTYFKEKHGVFQSCYRADTYSSVTPDMDWEESKDSLGLSNQAIPYFGIKTGENASIAYVSSGQAMSNITFCPSGYVIPVNRIGAGFTYRQAIATSSANGQWQSGDDTMVFEEKPEEYTAAVEYQFLSGKNANYSKMAEKLRKYMESEGILIQSELVKNKQMPLAIDLFGGYNKNLLVFNKYITGTTLSQATKIVDTLEAVPVLCNYRGAFSEGYGVYPTEYQLEKKLGTDNKIRNLASRLRDGGGQLFLESNQLLADYDQSGYRDGDLTISNRFQVLKNIREDTKFLLSPEIIKKRQKDKILPALKKYGGTGLNETLLGSFVYADFGNSHNCTRLETVSTWEELLLQEKKQLGVVGVDGGSDYVFAAADWLRNVPNDVSGYIYTDEAIPFYSMVVHGYMACTSIPDNEFYDEKIQTLRAIEYGFLPYFSLTAEGIDTGSMGVYTSEFSSIYPKLVSTYNLYVEALGDLTDVPITSHKRKGDLVKITYENGTEIIINYSDSAVEIDGVKVEPESFVKLTKAEVEKNEKQSKLEEKAVKVKTQGEQGRLSVYSPLVVGIFIFLFVSIVLFGSISFFNSRRS